MASRRNLIVHGVVEALREITVANGWAIDLVVQHALQDRNTMAGAVAVSRDRAFVFWGRDNVDYRSNETYVTRRLGVTIDCFPAQQDDTTPLVDVFDPILRSVERRLMMEVARSASGAPPFGVAGVVDIELDAEMYILDEGSGAGASFPLTVVYRHDPTNPETYAGSAD